MDYIITIRKQKGSPMLDASTVLLIYGIILLVMSTKYLSEPKEVTPLVKEMLSSHFSVLIAGFLALVFGLITMFAFMPAMHSSNMALITTIIGGFLSLVGVFRLWFTDTWCSIVKKYSKSHYLSLIIGIYFLIGLLFIMMGSGIIPIK